MTRGDNQLLDEAKNLFEYLAQVQRVRETPVRTTKQYETVFWLGDFPTHNAVQSAHRAADPAAEDDLFSVDRVLRIDPPVPPDGVSAWIAGDLADPNTEPVLLEWVDASAVPTCVPRMAGDGPSEKVLLGDEPGVRAAANEFLAAWKSWAAVEQSDRPVRDLYTNLFAAHQTAVSHSESFELVLGVGVLSWRPDDHEAVQRHLVTFPAQITFDEATGRLTAAREAGTIPLAIELDMLDPALVSRQVTDLKAATLGYEAHPLHRDLIGLEVTRFAHTLDAQGSYVDDDDAPAVGPELRAAFAPALILRRRSQRGLIDMFDAIRRQLEEAGEVPPGLLPLIDPDYRPESSPDDSPGGIVEVDDEIFLPMPVNERQLKVIQAVNSKAQVVVQGPPGTGKTHTAAALLSHLLAQGKRVLVTAHTDRALHEVRDKLPAEIRPLSVAVVGSSQAEMADLRVAVETISSKADEYDASDTKRQMESHVASIDRLRRERAETFTALRVSREAETAVLSTNAYSGTLAAIAQQVQADEDSYGWIHDFDAISADGSSPLSNSEAVEWLELLTDADLLADEPESRSAFPEESALPAPTDLGDAFDLESFAAEHAQAHADWRSHPLFPDIAALGNDTRTALHERTSSLAKALDDLESRSEGWVADAVRDVRTGRRQSWQARADQVASLVEQAQPFVVALGPLTTVVADRENLPALDAMARALHAHVTRGDTIKLRADGTPKLGAFSAKVLKQSQPFFDAVRVNGIPATTQMQLEAFTNYASSTQVLDALDRSWPANVHIPEEDTLDERLQWHITEHAQLLKVLAIADQLSDAEEWVTAHGLKAPDWADLADVQSYAALVDAAMSADARDAAQSPLEALQGDLERQAAWDASSPVIGALLEAVVDRNRNAYREAHDRLRHLHSVRAKAARRDELGARLSAAAPQLAGAVSASASDAAWRERLAKLTECWRWAAAAAWIRAEERADVNALQRRLDYIETQLRTEIESLAAARAWSHAVDESRMSGTARAHLRQYAGLVRRLGKGTGKYAAKQRLEIKGALDQCRPSVPVWIMPIYRIAEQFRIESNMFDVVLVDEASQAGLEAAFLQYLAPKIVVVGDDKQVSPSAVGVDQQQLRDLANQYLPNNPFKASWQDPKRSYFDEATMRFGGKITLVEHRRCVPEIIGFSNKIAYEPDNIRLIPVRQRPAGALTPVRRVHVADGYEKGRTNPAEADAIVEQIVECAADPAYDGKSFGVISLMGKEQAKLIATKLLDRLPPDEWASRDLRCGDAADFQGSERDVVFLSMVKAAEPGRRVGTLATEMYVQRYNVAASRAKDQMWLFHSLLLGDLGNPEDMRHALLDYVTNVETRQDLADDRIRQDLVPEDERVEPFDSLFEQRVFNRIHGRGYSVIPQFPAEGYKIDLVVVGANGNLAIECDGDTWHGPEHYLKDLARQRDLERCGWTFFRIRESSYYLDPEEALSELWPQLEALTAPTPPTEPESPHILEATLEVSSPGVEEVSPTVDVAPQMQSPLLAPAVEHRRADGLTPRPSAVPQREAELVESLSLEQSRLVVEPEDTALAFDEKTGIDDGQTYVEYSGPAVPTPLATRAQIIDHLVDAVAAEGPVRGSRLLTAYVKASGGQKVGSQIAKDLNGAISAAVRQGRIVEDNPLGETGIKPRTYRLHEQPAHRVRPLGPRNLEDVPPLEIAARLRAAQERLGRTASPTALYRIVLDDMGLKRLTPNVESVLARALSLIDVAVEMHCE